MANKRPGPKKSAASLKLDRLRAERLERENQEFESKLISLEQTKREFALMRAEMAKVLAAYPEIRDMALERFDQILPRLQQMRPKVASLHRRNVGAWAH